MENNPFKQTPEGEQQNEREPQPHDIALATREALKQLAPDADPQDVEEGIALIEGVTDSEEAHGYAASLFPPLDVDYEQGLSLLGEILQVERYKHNGDIHQK